MEVVTIRNPSDSNVENNINVTEKSYSTSKLDKQEKYFNQTTQNKQIVVSKKEYVKEPIKKNYILAPMIVVIIILALFNTLLKEIPSREMDSLLMGVSIYSFIAAIFALFYEGKLDWSWLNRFMERPKELRIVVPFIIGLIVAFFFYIAYTNHLNGLGSQISNSAALIAFSLVITNYLDETKKEKQEKVTREINKGQSILYYLFEGIFILFTLIILFCAIFLIFCKLTNVLFF